MQKDKSTKKQKDDKNMPGNNADLEGNDKLPGEEQGKSEMVTNRDLKGKKVDANPELDSDKPVKQQ
jgi:hypothetical protein